MQSLPYPPPRYLPPRTPNGHKGTYGHCVVIGGSPGMSGAIALTGMAALRSGAGLVTIATHNDCQAIVASFNPCYMTVGISDDLLSRDSLPPHELNALLARADAVAIGPGWGQSPGATRLVSHLFRHLSKPLVLDADGLNAMSAIADWKRAIPAPRILTPHPGEFRRMLGMSHQSPDRPRLCDLATKFAGDHDVVVVLKGQNTFITDGKQHYENPTGNPGMATGGTGDVLTGVVCALLGQGLGPLEATQLAVFVHGLAGDMAAERYGQVSLTATDVVEGLSPAFKLLTSPPSTANVGTD